MSTDPFNLIKISFRSSLMGSIKVFIQRSFSTIELSIRFLIENLVSN